MLTTFRSIILYHTNNPRWNERITLFIPPAIYETCHVYFEIKTASSTSSKDIGFGFLPLFKEDGTVIDDGHHDIKLFKVGKNFEHDFHNQLTPFYLNDTSKLILRKEVLYINTFLCSTALTQQSYIRSLLRWRSHPSQISEILNRLTFGDPFEIVKFFQEIFDAMFQILDESNDESIENLVYDSILFVLLILVDEKGSKFSTFRPVLDAYLNCVFHSSSSYLILFRCWKKTMNEIDQVKANNNLLSTLKSITYLLKIIKKSISLKYANNKQYKISDDDFVKLTLENLFYSLIEFMKKTSPSLIGAQVISLRVFISFFYSFIIIINVPIN